MSLKEAKMFSLADKINEQAKEVKVSEKKGREITRKPKKK